MTQVQTDADLKVLEEHWPEAAQRLRADLVKMRHALTQIEATPVSMVNDSDSLRHSIKTMQHIARRAIP